LIDPTKDSSAVSGIKLRQHGGFHTRRKADSNNPTRRRSNDKVEEFYNWALRTPLDLGKNKGWQISADTATVDREHPNHATIIHNDDPLLLVGDATWRRFCRLTRLSRTRARRRPK
jgi:hypothetical protein